MSPIRTQSTVGSADGGEQFPDRVEQVGSAGLATGRGCRPGTVHTIQVDALLGEREMGPRVGAVVSGLEHGRCDRRRGVHAVEPHVVGLDDPLVGPDVGVRGAELGERAVLTLVPVIGRHAADPEVVGAWVWVRSVMSVRLCRVMLGQVVAQAVELAFVRAPVGHDPGVGRDQRVGRPSPGGYCASARNIRSSLASPSVSAEYSGI